MTGGTDEISNLASILRENGDKVLNGVSKLSLNASLLYEISSKLGEFTPSDRDSDPFEVLSPLHGLSRTMDHLQLLHDFFQKTVGLKVENSANLLAPGCKIDISKFKKLKYLELKRVPVKQIIGFKLVQHQLECIVCERGMTALEHLLAECGGDNSTGFVWSELKEAVLSFNDIRILDSSVAFAPRLQVLDLSHNHIYDVNAIERLPNLKYVNLSFNSLTAIPLFNNSARKQMQVLVLKNNFIEDVSPLFGLDCLTELDLSYNLICGVKSFRQFLSMSTLRWLSVVGNPVCSAPSYRLAVVRNLHINGACLSKRERENVGIEVMRTTQFDSNAFPVVEVQPSILSTETVNTKKRGKIRVAVIPNLDGTYEDIPPELHNVNLSAPSNNFLSTKQRIRKSLEADIEFSPQPEINENVLKLSSTPYNDACIDAILNNVCLKTETNVITTVATIEPIPRHLQTEDESYLTCNDDNASAYFSLNESEETKETSPDIETIADPEEEEQCQMNIYLAVRLFHEGSEIRRVDLFLTLSDTELREKDASDNRTLCCWSLASLESAILIREKEVHLVFDTIRRDRRERFYEFEPHEAAEFYRICRSELEGKSLSDMKQVPYRCVACSLEFVVEKNPKIQKVDIACPVCGSKIVIQEDETQKENLIKNKSTHNRSASVGGARDIVNHVSKCSSQSNMDSATSFSERCYDTSNFYANGKRCDSDIEIISNPSESSIEVIDAPNRAIENEQLPLEKLLTPSAAAVVAFTGLTESSSSGSITDSICTAYENSSMASSGLSKKSGLESSTLIEEPSEKDCNYLVKDVETSKKSKPNKDIDLIKYSYTNFADLDHRIKLFVYAHLLEDDWEECAFLLRCQVLSPREDNCFDACFVCSDVKCYIVKITGPENGEEANKFLLKCDNYCFNVNALRKWEILSWDQGFSVTFQSSADKSTDLLILLKDMERTKSFFKFVQKFEGNFPKCEWIKTPNFNAALRVTQCLVQHAEDSTLLTALGFLECRINKETLIRDGAIFVTPTDLFIVNSIRWISNKQEENIPIPISSQKLSDLIQVNVSDQNLSLQFMNELENKQYVWNLSMTSETVVDQLLNHLRTPWEALFSVQLQVTQNEFFS